VRYKLSHLTSVEPLHHISNFLSSTDNFNP
jgi:hypothetical protein